MVSTSKTPLLDKIDYPKDLRKLPRNKLEDLAAELRNETIDAFIEAFNRRRDANKKNENVTANDTSPELINITIPGFKPLIAMGQTINVDGIPYKVKEENGE